MCSSVDALLDAPSAPLAMIDYQRTSMPTVLFEFNKAEIQYCCADSSTSECRVEGGRGGELSTCTAFSRHLNHCLDLLLLLLGGVVAGELHTGRVRTQLGWTSPIALLPSPPSLRPLPSHQAAQAALRRPARPH